MTGIHTTDNNFSKIIPNEPHLLVFMSLGSLLPHWIRAEGCSELPIGEDEWLLKLGHNGIEASTLFSWVVHSGGSQLPNSENTQVALESSQGKELRSPTNSKHHLTSHLEVDPPSSVKPSADISLQPLESYPKPEPPIQTVPESLTYRETVKDNTQLLY